jgi:hypothetical protein
MHLHDSIVIAIWLIVFYAIWAATEAGDPGFGQLSFFIVGLVLTFVLKKLKFENTIEFKEMQRTWKKQQQIDRAKEREKALDYDSAIEIWESLGEISEAARVRKLKIEQSAVKVDQTVVHGDYVDDRDTIVKDSVINRSTVGNGEKTKAEEIKEIKELHDTGAIDDDEFKQMKKEILGK